MKKHRREFIRDISLMTAGMGIGNTVLGNLKTIVPLAKPYFEFSLAEFSFASEIWGGKMTNLDFAARAKKEFGISVVEYVSMFFNNKHTDPAYLADLKKRSDDAGVTNHLIMVDDANLADLDDAKRKQAVEAHYPWVDAAKYLGCSSMRVNLGILEMPGTAAEEAKAAVDGYGRLLEYGDKLGINIIVENHIGRSCNAQWLVGVMKAVNHPRAGVLPDFGNFCINRTKPATQDIAGYMATKCLENYDVYKGVEELMPYAKGVSAKSHKFNAAGDEAELDFKRLFTIIKDSGFKGYVGIEYEGGLLRDMGKDNSYLDNAAGVKATKKLIEKVAFF